MGKYSLGSADKTVVKIEDEGLGKEMTELWQKEYNKVTHTAPEVMVYSLNGITMESTGDRVAFQSIDPYPSDTGGGSEPPPKEEEEEEEEGGIFDWFKDAWDKTKETISNAWDGFTGWVADKLEVIVGVIVGVVITALVAFLTYILGGLHSPIDDDEDKKAGDMLEKVRAARETIVKIINADVNKMINEKAQKAAFGKTFKDINSMREDQIKSRRENIGQALDKINKFDLINTVVNKPLQKLFLGVTLDTFRKDLDKDKEQLTSPTKRATVKDLVEEAKRERAQKSKVTADNKTEEKASEKAEKKPAAFKATFTDNGKSFESGQYRQQKTVSRNWSVNTRAHVLDALIKADINVGINKIVGKAILGEDIYTIKDMMDQTEKAYKQEEHVKEKNAESMELFLEKQEEFAKQRAEKMNSKEKAHYDKADDAGHQERRPDWQIRGEIKNNSDFFSNLSPREQIDVVNAIKTMGPEYLEAMASKNSPQSINGSTLEAVKNAIEAYKEVRDDIRPELLEDKIDFYKSVIDKNDKSKEDLQKKIEEMKGKEEAGMEDIKDPILEERNEVEDKNEGGSNGEENSAKETPQSSEVKEVNDANERSIENEGVEINENNDEATLIEEKFGAILESLKSELESSTDNAQESYEENIQDNGVEPEEIDSNLEKHAESLSEAGEDAEETSTEMVEEGIEIVVENPSDNSEDTVEVVESLVEIDEDVKQSVLEENKEEREEVSVEVNTAVETNTVESVQDTDQINRFEGEFIETSDDIDEQKEHQTDGSRNEAEGKVSSQESDKHVDK